MIESNRISRRSILFALLVFIPVLPCLAGDITLAWDANTEADLAGYKVYYGSTSGIYGAPIIIGTQTTYTITGLPAGTFYFAVTAYNTAGLESGYSNEVSATITAGSPSSGCDINADTYVNVLDLQALVNVILGINTPASPIDLNGDGRTDVLDLQILCNVALGIRSCP